MKLKPTLIMNQGSFRDQFFCSPSPKGFNEMKYFSFLGQGSDQVNGVGEPG